jgi:excisionase family DNA binding protein
MPFQGTAMPKTGSVPAEKLFYLVAEVATRFRVDQTTVHRMIKAGRLRAIRMGTGRGTWRVPAAALADYEASLTAAATSAELTVDTPLGTVDLVAVDRARAGREVALTEAETALVALLTARSAELAGVA